MYLSGNLNFAEFVIFLLLSSVFLNSFLKIVTLGSNLSMLLVGAENVRTILTTKEQYSNNEDKKPKIKNGEIVFKNVNFAYEEVDVIKDFSLTISFKSSTALVDPSGSENTTVAMLIGRF